MLDRNIKKIIFFILSLALIAFGFFVLFADDRAVDNALSRRVKRGSIPAQAEIVLYDSSGFIYVMDMAGGNLAQITFENPRRWHHAAVSYDRRYVAASAWVDAQNMANHLFLFDLASGMETRLVPSMRDAGNGGVDWDEHGFLYFPARRTDSELSDIFKIKPDGTHLTQLTHTATEAEVDVSVGGGKVAYIKGTPNKSNGTVNNDVWLMNADGSDQRLVVDSAHWGKPGPTGLADPELSPDGKFVVYSDNNFEVAPNPEINTAHDLWVAPIDQSASPRRITMPGSVSIIPDWKENVIIFTEINTKEMPAYKGMSFIKICSEFQNCDAQGSVRIKLGFTFGKWIP